MKICFDYAFQFKLVIAVTNPSLVFSRAIHAQASSAWCDCLRSHIHPDAELSELASVKGWENGGCTDIYPEGRGIVFRRRFCEIGDL